ncbi:MAG: hypothetical protein NVSMB64_22670 [Candidatus Velthaea sp.]
MNNLAIPEATMTLARRLNLSPEKLELVRSQIAPGAPDDVLELYFERCRISGFDPFAKMLYCISRFDKQSNSKKWTMQTSIDGFRSIAEDSGEYDGQDEPTYKFDERNKLVSATVKVYRKNMSRGVAATADWAEYNAGGPMWEKMPKGQLAKCAEALAFRKAFPKKLNGVLSTDEMAQADRPTPVATMPPLPAIVPAAGISITDIANDYKRLQPGGDFRAWLNTAVGVPLDQKRMTQAQKEHARELLDDGFPVPPEVDEAQLVQPALPAAPPPPSSFAERSAEIAERGKQRERDDDDAFEKANNAADLFDGLA